MKIAVAGTGYVGVSIATLLSQNHEVMAVDIVPEDLQILCLFHGRSFRRNRHWSWN